MSMAYSIKKAFEMEVSKLPSSSGNQLSVLQRGHPPKMEECIHDKLKLYLLSLHASRGVVNGKIFSHACVIIK